MPSIQTRHGGRRRQQAGQAQQQAPMSRLESDNLIDSSNMNMNGAALMTGLGKKLVRTLGID